MKFNVSTNLKKQYNSYTADCVICAFSTVVNIAGYSATPFESFCSHKKNSNRPCYRYSRVKRCVALLFSLITLSMTVSLIYDVLHEKDLIKFWCNINELLLYLVTTHVNVLIVSTKYRMLELQALVKLVESRKKCGISVLMERRIIQFTSIFFVMATIFMGICSTIYQVLMFLLTQCHWRNYLKLACDFILYYQLGTQYIVFMCFFLYYHIIFGKFMEKLKEILTRGLFMESNFTSSHNLKYLTRFYQAIIKNYRYMFIFGTIPLFMCLLAVIYYAVFLYIMILSFNEILGSYLYLLLFLKYFVLMVGMIIYFQYMQHITTVVSNIFIVDYNIK